MPWQGTIFKQQAASAAPARPKRSVPPAVSPPADVGAAAFDIGLGDCHFNVVGESHYQGRLRNLSTAGRSFTAALMPEPTNAFDPNAIRVVAEGAGRRPPIKEDAVYCAPVFWARRSESRPFAARKVDHLRV